MIQKTQFVMTVTVAVAGIAFWVARQDPTRDQAKHETADVIVERSAPADAGQPDLKTSESEIRPKATQPEVRSWTAPAQPIDVTDATFASLVLGSEKPVLVDFGAQWCGACRMLEPTIHELASELGDQAMVAQIDVDANPQVAAQYGIEALPTLLVFKNGEVVDGVVGAASKTELRAKIDPHTTSDATLL